VDAIAQSFKIGRERRKLRRRQANDIEIDAKTIARPKQARHVRTDSPPLILQILKRSQINEKVVAPIAHFRS
jgi:hypothetical protein